MNMYGGLICAWKYWAHNPIVHTDFGTEITQRVCFFHFHLLMWFNMLMLFCWWVLCSLIRLQPFFFEFRILFGSSLDCLEVVGLYLLWYYLFHLKYCKIIGCPIGCCFVFVLVVGFMCEKDRCSFTSALFILLKCAACSVDVSV